MSMQSGVHLGINVIKNGEFSLPVLARHLVKVENFNTSNRRPLRT